MTFHDLRRAVADRMRRASVTIDVYCRFMGHAAITGLKHYATVDEADLRQAHAAALGGGRRRHAGTVRGQNGDTTPNPMNSLAGETSVSCDLISESYPSRFFFSAKTSLGKSSSPLDENVRIDIIGESATVGGAARHKPDR